MTQNFFRWLINCIVRATCILKITGYENLPATGGYIIASNHLGRLDVLLVYTSLNRKDIIMTIAEKYQKYWFVRVAAKSLDAIFIDRFNGDFRTLRKVIRRLKNGEVLAIAPEGTRSKTATLLDGKPGAAYLALKTQLPIIPVALVGTEDQLVKSNIKSLRRSRVSVTVGKPFYLTPLQNDSRADRLQKATDEIMVQIARLLPGKYRGVYTDRVRKFTSISALDNE